MSVDISKHTIGFIIVFLQFYGILPAKILNESGGRTGLSALKGTPGIIHYTKEDYNSDSQFWTMTEDAEGILYFGNNDGVVIFDGEWWQLVKLPNGSTVRSLYYAADGKVYVGGYNEIGTIDRNEYGQFYYESLVRLIRIENRNFEDIWSIHEIQGFIVFRSFKVLIAISHNAATTIPTQSIFRYSNVVNDNLFIVDEWGIKSLDLKTLEFSEWIESNKYNWEEICLILPGRSTQEYLAFTRQGHSYLVYPEEHKLLFHIHHFPDYSSDQIFCGIRSDRGIYYLGTINSQIITYEFNESGDFEKSEIKNLQDNTVLKLYETRDGNVWGMLNKGIDCIELASPISMIFENAAIYDAIAYKNNLFLATNQGVYSAKIGDGRHLAKSDFKIVKELEAQAWSIRYYEGKLVIGHDKGVFIIDGNKIDHIIGTGGTWKVIPVNGHPKKYLACTYNGLFLLQVDEKGKFVLRRKIEGFDISTRDIMQTTEPGVFWVCHGYEGVYRIKIDNELERAVSIEHFTEHHGLPSPYNINIYTWRGDTVFTTNNGIYQFDRSENRFVIHKYLTRILGSDILIRKLLEYEDLTWFIQDDELGYFSGNQENPVPNKDVFLSLKGSFVKSMEFILPQEDQKVLVGTTNGLYLFDLTHEPSGQPVSTLITGVTYINKKDSLVHGRLKTDVDDPLYLPYNTSSLNFRFAAPGFNTQTGIQYSYKLESMDQTWSRWSSGSTKEYSYLKSGNYVLKVRSRSLLGGNSDEAHYYFEIMPVWYQTRFVLIIFSLIGIFVIAVIIKLVRRKIKITRLEEQKLRKVLELELQQIRLEREKEKIIKDNVQLEGDVIHKSKELVNYTMLLVKKRELLSEMNGELKEIKESIRNETTREKIRSISKKINLNLQDEEHLQVFDTNFERAHQDFFSELKANYPDLTQKELRLCGFVKMNLTNKEIASILNISVRGVETARYRLRKRLSLSQNINMVEFLEKLSSADDHTFEEQGENGY